MRGTAFAETNYGMCTCMRVCSVYYLFAAENTDARGASASAVSTRQDSGAGPAISGFVWVRFTALPRVRFTDTQRRDLLLHLSVAVILCTRKCHGPPLRSGLPPLARNIPTDTFDFRHEARVTRARARVSVTATSTVYDQDELLVK